jgi:hypothetical protein
MRDCENGSERTEPEVDGRTIRRRGYPRWGRIAALALIAAGTAWGIGREASRRIQDHDIAIASRVQPRAQGFPDEAPIAAHNNMIMRMGLVADLDGRAVAYTAEADGLVVDGNFRTDFSLRELAAILHVRPESIAHPKSPGEINPDAVLFRTQAGVLTENARRTSRAFRSRQL